MSVLFAEEVLKNTVAFAVPPGERVTFLE